MPLQRLPLTLVVVAVVATACTGEAPGSPSAQAGSPRSETTSSLTSTAPPPTVTPAPLPTGMPGFTTASPPPSTLPWTGIEWQRVPAGDPITFVRSITRWRGGYFAVGRPMAVDDQRSRSPVWTSADGAAWTALDVGALGPAAIVVGIGTTDDGIVAITLRGGANQCDGDDQLYCWTLAAPIESWTSPDAVAWTAHPGPPELALSSPGCPECGAGIPSLRTGAGGLLLYNELGRIALSPDGVAWEVLPESTLPSAFDVHDIDPFAGGFVAVGDDYRGPGDFQALGLTSADGRRWTSHAMPTALGPGNSTMAETLEVGPHGLIATGTTSGAPGRSIWWRSATGITWQAIEGYPPLGVWVGDGIGSGDRPNGILVGDGDRILAYRGDEHGAGWTSLDGQTWLQLAISAGGPTSRAGYAGGYQVLTPIGLLGTGNDGSPWFGQPTT